jgi:hypothetical protein
MSQGVFFRRAKQLDRKGDTVMLYGLNRELFFGLAAIRVRRQVSTIDSCQAQTFPYIECVSMSSSQPTPRASAASDIPTEIALKFLTALETQKVSAQVIGRLRAVLLSEKTPSRKALADALFAEEPLS